jgi:hypothetical protein
MSQSKAHQWLHALLGRLPMQRIVRHQTLDTAAAQHILDAIAHLTHRVFAGSTSRFFCGPHGFQDLPLLIGQVTGVSKVPGVVTHFEI